MASSYVVLLRGVNVGGSGSLRMTAFAAVLQKSGCTNVKTYIQSGNAVCRAEATSPAKLAELITSRLLRSHGVRTEAIILTRRELERVLLQNPFREAEEDPRTLHVFFSAAAPRKPDLAALEDARGSRERFQLKGKVFYLHAPEGIGRSKLVPRVERSLGVLATARNWRTCSKLLEIAQDLESAGG